MDTFARHNFHMLRYNSRGVGRSTGWASLTGSSEGEDLCALVKRALERIGNVQNLVLVVYMLFSDIKSSKFYPGILIWLPHYHPLPVSPFDTHVLLACLLSSWAKGMAYSLPFFTV